jgi:hypothetical protein
MIAGCVLTAITLVSGIIGTYWDHPPHRATILVVFLVGSSVVTFVQGVSSDKDKELVQNLAIASLALPNSAYDTVYRQMDEAYFDGSSVGCRHTKEGMTCPLPSAGGQPARTLVFNSYEVAQVYADAIRGRDTKGFLKEIAQKRYDPKQLSDEYEDKLGILGSLTFFEVCGRFPEGYDYDDGRGVKVYYKDGGARKVIALTSDEMTDQVANPAPVLFGFFNNLFRNKIYQAFPSCQTSFSENRSSVLGG